MMTYNFGQSIPRITYSSVAEFLWIWVTVSVSRCCWTWFERVKHLWHPSVLLTWLCVGVQFNHCNPLPPTPRWLILFDWDLLSTQIIALHYHVIPSCKRRIKMFSAVRYFYPPTSLSVNYSKYSYIKIKPLWIGRVQQAALFDTAVMVKPSQWYYLHMCVPSELIILSWALKMGTIMNSEGDKHSRASYLTLGVQQLLMTA